MTTVQALADYQFCPRKRWWAHEYKGTGIADKKPVLSHALDYAVRHGLAALYRGEDVSRAAVLSEAKFSAITTGGLLLSADEDEAYVIEEQGAFANAIVRAYSRAGLVLGKDLREAGYVEPSLALNTLSFDRIHIDARPDALIALDNKVTAIFWRLCAGPRDIDAYSDRHRIVAGVLAAEEVYSPVECELHYIFKGSRANFGISRWVDLLHPGVISNQFRRVKREADFSLIQMLSEDGKREWREQIQYQENLIRSFTPSPTEAEGIPRPFLPQYRHSCRYCQFTRICDQRIDRPEEYGYRLRRESL